MRRLLAAIALLLVAAGCSGDPGGDVPEVAGIVVDVDGDLTSVQSFTVVDESGTSFTFVPEEGLTFHDGPLSHLSSHVTSGEPIVVGYESRDDGTLVAVSVDDA